jgi:DNA-binding protein HU-beta
MTKADAGKAVNAVVSIITTALKQSEEVRIAAFGTFGISQCGTS